MTVVFNKPFIAGRELLNIADAHFRGRLAGDGDFSKLCQAKIEEISGVKKALLTHSCTASLEMAAILANIQPGDEIIMPSYTFVSTANAFVLRGGVPVFVDVRNDTLNIDERLIESAVTNRTRAVVPVHYAGVGCEMDVITDIARRNNLLVIEDAAQAFLATYRGRMLGSIGDLGCYSFHETKNIISGEGGALLIRDSSLIERAEIVREKGTDRSRFFRGQVDKYTWCDIGSSYLPSELIAAFLWAQLEERLEITRQRIAIWNRYHEAFSHFESKGIIRRPVIPIECQHNGHLYYLIMESLSHRTSIIKALHDIGVMAVFHYVPLHCSPAGRRFGRESGTMKNTNELSERLLRLPLWIGVDTDRVIDAVSSRL